MKELEDFEWFPPLLRRFQTDFIGSMVVWAHTYRPLGPILDRMLSQNPGHEITDLCAGNAGPVIYLSKFLQQRATIHVTDKFPSRNLALPSRTKHHFIMQGESYDVLGRTYEQGQVYSMFNAFHHFSPAEQQAILDQMAKVSAPFLIVEILQPTLFEAIKIALAATVGQAATAPFVRPFSLLRLFFTYVCPVNLLTVCWDGLVSVVKARPLGYYAQLAQRCSRPDYPIHAYTVRSSFFTTLTVISTEAPLTGRYR